MWFFCFWTGIFFLFSSKSLFRSVWYVSRRLCLEICWLPIDWTTIGLAPPFPSLKADQIVLWGVLSSRFYIFFSFLEISRYAPYYPFYAHHCDDNCPSSWVVASALKSVCQEDPASHWKVIVGSPYCTASMCTLHSVITMVIKYQ